MFQPLALVNKQQLSISWRSTFQKQNNYVSSTILNYEDSKVSSNKMSVLGQNVSISHWLDLFRP